MIKLKRILVPIDGSVHSKNSAKYAAYVASSQNAEVILLHVWHLSTSLIGGDAAVEVKKELAEESEKILAETLQHVKDCGHNATTLSKEGIPDYTILEVQKELDCDMVIMGSRGMSSFEGFMIGSMAHKILKLASCPVMITRNLREKYLENACIS